MRKICKKMLSFLLTIITGFIIILYLGIDGIKDCEIGVIILFYIGAFSFGYLLGCIFNKILRI